MDPSALISPVTDALGTLGSGLFEGVDPTQMLAGISNAFGSTGPQLQQSLAAVDDAWQGASGTAAATKTTEAIANGSEVAAQSDGLRTSLAAAAADVAQARARLIAIVAEFAATIAAIGPNIIFPWGWAAAIAAANKAIASAAEVMTELQSSLAAQAAEATAVGEPVDVLGTRYPQTFAPTKSSTSQPASGTSSMASQLMSMATKGAQAGIQAGTGAASAASQEASKSAAIAPVGGGAAGVPPPGGGAGSGGGGAGGGAGGTAPLRSVATSSMVQAETGSAPAQSAPVRTAGGSGGGGFMGAPYAPMAGAGHGANASSNTHTTASFLQTTDQGGEIVGDLGTAAPPVLGQADPNEPPDVELRI